MLKVIPVEEAIGLPLAHDITEIVPGKHKGPAFRRGHVVQSENISKLLDVAKAHIYVMELEKDEHHEEDAARRLAKAAAGPNIRLSDPVEGRDRSSGYSARPQPWPISWQRPPHGVRLSQAPLHRCGPLPHLIVWKYSQIAPHGPGGMPDPCAFLEQSP